MPTLAAAAAAAAAMLSLGTSATERLAVQGDARVGAVLATVASERFSELRWDSDGSVAGFIELLSGTADVAVSSRRPNEREREIASRLGLELREHVLALDALAVVVHPENRVDELSRAQLETLYTGGMVRWMGMGGSGDAVRLLAPSRASGVLDVFREMVLNERSFVSSVSFTGTGVELVREVAGNPQSVGIVSMNVDHSAVKALRVEGASPTSVEVAGGRYPLWCAIYAYTLGEPVGRVHGLLAWLLLQEGQERLRDAGYVSLRAAAPIRRRALESPPREGDVLVLDRVSFGRGGVGLRRAARDVLDGLVARLRVSEEALLVVGHATEEEAPELSDARARAVADFVERRGLEPGRFRLEAAGSAEPVAADPDSNRRVDIWILPNR